MLSRIVSTWAFNIVNATVFLLSGGRRVWHEGRYRRGRWTDWYRMFGCRPRQWAQPDSEEEICRLVAGAERVRVVGAGHSFNAAPLTDGLLLSLDRFNAVTVRDDPDRPDAKIAAVQAGVRLRDLNRTLVDHGADLPAAGSTNPQSIGGLLATDLHGTGRDHGFLSEVVQSLRIVDAQGHATTCHPGDDLFHAAIGGAGTCGVIIGAELRCVPAYNLSKAVRVVPRRWAEDHLDALLAEHTHLSFYYLGGLGRSRTQEEQLDVAPVRMNTWDRTVGLPSRGRQVLRIFEELSDLIFAGHLMGVARALHVTDLFARMSMRLYALMVNHRATVYPAQEGFARLLYFRHDEIEHGIPREALPACMDEVRELLRRRRYPTIVEIRFTPDRSQALLGPGVGRDTAYVQPAPSTSRATDSIFQEFEAILLRHGGRPHLGKKTYVDAHTMDAIYGREQMERFRTVRRTQDPHGKFLNPFTRRVLGDPSDSGPESATHHQAHGSPSR